MVKKRILQILTVLIVLSPLIVLAVLYKSNGKAYMSEGYYFDTYLTVTVYSLKDSEYLDECMKMCERYDTLLGRNKHLSDIDCINEVGYEGVALQSEETYYLLERALEFCEETDGAVDITVAPLSDIWGFSHDSMGNPTATVKPTDEMIKDTLKSVNYKNVKLTEDNGVFLLDENTKVDLGFIAKGYIADKIKEYLVENGVKSAIISLGGNVVVIGSKPDGSDFKIGIKDPDNSEGIIDSVSVKDKSVVTSGTYERYVEYDGVKYHHILDTKTGYPVDTDVKSVTVISDSSLEGDALSTVCLILGEEKSKPILEKYNATAIFH